MFVIASISLKKKNPKWLAVDSVQLRQRHEPHSFAIDNFNYWNDPTQWAKGSEHPSDDNSSGKRLHSIQLWRFLHQSDVTS